VVTTKSKKKSWNLKGVGILTILQPPTTPNGADGSGIANHHVPPLVHSLCGKGGGDATIFTQKLNDYEPQKPIVIKFGPTSQTLA
jgi:hypothetical protein